MPAPAVVGLNTDDKGYLTLGKIMKAVLGNILTGKLMCVDTVSMLYSMH